MHILGHLKFNTFLGTPHAHPNSTPYILTLTQINHGHTKPPLDLRLPRTQNTLPLRTLGHLRPRDTQVPSSQLHREPR